MKLPAQQVISRPSGGALEQIIPWIATGFSVCCCVAFAIALLAIGAMLLRPKRQQYPQTEGVPAPERGQRNLSSLTKLENQATLRPKALNRDAAPADPPPSDNPPVLKKVSPKATLLLPESEEMSANPPAQTKALEDTTSATTKDPQQR